MTEKTDKDGEPKRRSNARERIIDAAVTVVQTDMTGKLSLDAVAECAGVSKGGLLYHFHSKSALLQAMIARHVDTLGQAIHDAHAEISRDARPNAMVRAYLQAFRDKLCSGKKPARGMLAAIAEEPALLDPVRAHHAKLIAELKRTSDDPELAILAFLAVEGIWNLRLFETSPFDEAELTGHFDSLIDLLANPPRR